MKERRAFGAAPFRSWKHVAPAFLFLLCVQTSFAQGVVDLPSRPVDLMQALQSTLEQHPEIQLQRQQVEMDRGALLTAAAPFDSLWKAGFQQGREATPLTRLQQISAIVSGVDATKLTSDTTSVNVSEQKLLRNGITFNPYAQLSRTLDNLSNTSGVNQATLTFTINVPLLQGRGRNAVAAQEISAGHNLDAGLLDVNQTVAQLLASTAVQYWNAVAAERNMEIAKASEERGRSYEQNVTTLIEADRVPRGEINQLRANLAQRKANFTAAEQSMMTARLNLTLAMGLRASEAVTMPLTTGALPDWSGPAPSITPELMRSFVAKALSRRADLMAADKRIEAAEALLPAAKNQLRRRVDLELSAGYSGLLENTNYFAAFGSPFRNLAGPNATASIQYSFPQENSAARGALIQAEAARRQSTLARENIERTIANNVVVAMVNLTKSVVRLQDAREAVKNYLLALNGEQDKYNLGASALIDVLTIEDRLTTASSDEVSAQLDYAVAVENLRFATGTLIDPKASTHSLDRRLFLTPPFDWERP
jgi:outer membrane protein TolC